MSPEGAIGAVGAVGPQRDGRWQRAPLWSLLLALLLIAQVSLLVLTVNFESTRAQDESETRAAQAASELRRELLGTVQALQRAAIEDASATSGQNSSVELLRQHGSLTRIEWRDPQAVLRRSLDAPLSAPLFNHMSRADLQTETEWTCAAARRASAPMFSRSYFVPLAAGLGQEVVDLCIPQLDGGREVGFLVGTVGLSPLLDTTLLVEELRGHEFSIVEGDGTRVARAGHARGAGVFVAERVVDLPGATLRLRADSASGRPSLVPNLATSLVVGLSLALFAVVWLLAHDLKRRAHAERALAEALAFRKAMEDSLSTGLRARDLQGVVTYANPAFCAMVGYSADVLRAARETPPYWPTESLDEYRQRQAQRLRATGPQAVAQAREGYETEFVRKNGERFPVMVYEAPLLDSQGVHTGWMSAVLDISAQRRVEELSRQQQERLQATARLATVGEMASLMSHELNQPLAAISSYASGSQNLLAQPDDQTPALLQQALAHIAEQAERAGRIIKGVHDFVRRREQWHESVAVAVLLEAVMPLVRLQARKSGTRIELRLPADELKVRCDRTMVEQVLMNLARNGIQAMESHTETPQRLLQLSAKASADGRRVEFSVTDAGPGVAPEVAAQLFTPFFTTRAEGMGLGLSFCRTVIEQHGGNLDFGPVTGSSGTEFRFTLPQPAVRTGA